MSQRYNPREVSCSHKKRDLKLNTKLNQASKTPSSANLKSAEQSHVNSSTKKRRWVEEFTHHGHNNHHNLKRRRIFVDLYELQHFGGLALCSNHVVNFKIVSSEEEMISDQEPFFNPKFSHQIFHKDETVRGYKDLNIDIFLSASTLRPYANITYSKRAENHDDIIGTLKKHFGDDALITERSEFIRHLNEEKTKFKHFGKKVGSFTRQMPVRDSTNTSILQKRSQSQKNSKVQVETKTFEIYKIEANTEKFLKLNRRLQALFIFFIDGASFISLDNNWCYFLVYQDNKLVAYSTAYEQKKPYMGKYRQLSNSQESRSSKSQSKYTYKLRISQFIVLPPYQRYGIGSTLLESMYNYYLADKKCTEITVEDPSEDFQQMKDALDIKLIWKNNFFQSFRNVFKSKTSLKSTTINKFNFDQLILDQQEIQDIQQVLKLKKQNILRCFELIILSKLDRNDTLVHQKFAQEVKRKFYYQMNKNLLQPYFQLENFYGSLLPTQINYDDQHHIYNQKALGHGCCDGDGKVISDEHVQHFENQVNRYHHHHYYPGTGSNGSSIPGILEYQRVYNKYTPTPLPTSGNLLYGNSGKNLNGNSGGSWPQFFSGVLGAPRFELPENLQKKILKIITSE